MEAKNISFYVMAMAALTACSADFPPHIYTVCERDTVGNYIIKWETAYPMEGKVDIYVSGDPDQFDLSSRPALSANISDCLVTYVTPDNITRQYFRLVVGNKYTYTVSERLLKMDSVPNLRDIGGYFTEDRDRSTCWGKIYRCGNLSRLSLHDSLRLDNLHLRTIIDMRSAAEMTQTPLSFGNTRIVSIPLTINTIQTVSDRLRADRLHRGDAIVHMQDAYLRLISENIPAFSVALHEFLLRDNYPILVTCTFGKDACGFLSSLLLAAVGVPENTILYDYLETGLTFDHIVPYLDYSPDELSAKAIEAAIVLLSADEAFFNPVHVRIRRDYGSFEQFLSTKLSLSSSDRTHLKNIILH
jgi:protein-tyrosine phosphatase